MLVVGFSRDLDAESIKSAAEALGDGLVGVIVNRVPTLGARVAEETLKPALESAGLTVLGIVPESRVLFGITVDDLVERLEGRYALEAEGRDLLVEHVMVGANLLDAEDFPAGPEYFGQRDKKAVIAKGDRPDFQWAAMNTPTHCLILTGDFEPIPYVLERAKELQVTIAVVEKDTLDTLDAIEEILSGPGLDSEAKAPRVQRPGGEFHRHGGSWTRPWASDKLLIPYISFERLPTVVRTRRGLYNAVPVRANLKRGAGD